MTPGRCNNDTMDDGLRNAIFLVTGSNLTAEQKDRPLAYAIKRHIDRYGGPEETKCGIVVSDLWYTNTDDVGDYPVISVGGPGVNALSQRFWNHVPVALAVDNVFMIQMDVTLDDLRAAVWGMDHQTTREAVQTFFLKGYLRRFLEAAWGETLEPIETQADESDPEEA
jgi:hypothetical protein